jgi:DNA mismatch endonuclease, patch repair protein
VPLEEPKTSEARSRIMRAVRSRNTGLEMRVRRLLHSMGYRYRLHASDLPGKPDIVFRPRRAVIFVHGCFWHGHDCQRGARMPRDNAEYWSQKIAKNAKRDQGNQELLASSGWRTLVLWECETRDLSRLARELRKFLGDG